MRKALFIIIGLAAAPVIALAQSQPPPSDDVVQNDVWANAAEVSNQFEAPSDPAVNDTLPPADEIERPELDAGTGR